ncbi:hypothetical protein ACXYL9_05830 [Qipengyuania sp. CAU 1752]
MSEPGGIGAPHIVGWVVTAAAFGGNLWWNWLNRKHANQLADDIRTEGFQKEIWDRHRGRIETQLEEFVTFVLNLPAQILAFPGDAEQAISLDIFELNLNVAHDGLARALSETNNSAYCHGEHWEEKAFGKQYDSEQSWDLLLSGFARAGRCKKRHTQVDALKELKAHALEIEYEVRVEIRKQEYRYHPNSS